MKKCSKCREIKSLDAFGVDRQKGNGLTSQCKECGRPRSREYCRLHRNEKREYSKRYLANEENREKRRAYAKAYRSKEENKSRMRAYGKKWRQLNQDKRKESKRRRWLQEALRMRFYIAVRKGYKAGSAVRDLGCSIDEFRIYMESKFTDGMTWDNWGEWHIDHVRPLAMFDLTKREDVLIACHFSNLQPLWAKDNLIKGAGCV